MPSIYFTNFTDFFLEIALIIVQNAVEFDSGT